MDTDKITTITQAIKSVVIILSIVGINIGAESTAVIATAAGSIYALAGMVQGWLTNKRVS